MVSRGIRAGKAPAYLGMDKNRFRKEVKPYLVAIEYGPKSKVYDKFDLDAWFEEYKRRNGIPGDKTCNYQKDAPGEKRKTGRTSNSSTSENNTVGIGSEALAERAILKKQKNA